LLTRGQDVGETGSSWALRKEASRLVVCPGPKRERFSKLVFSKWVLNKFEFWQGPIITIKTMHQHECLKRFANPMMNFNLMKTIIFLMFS
jgi:hypothetical protein